VATGDRAWRATLERYRSLVRESAAASGGRLVQMVGDGVVLTFATPGPALRCAEALCAEVRGLELELRVGVHTGECELVGDGLAGIAVHTCARICGLAESGEVLVSRTVRDLVAGSELAFADRGLHMLRGLPGSWRLFALGGGGEPPVALEGEAGGDGVPFPARLRTDGLFVGRETERERLRAAFAAAEAGAQVTVLVGGEPGIGKTRLAAAVAADARAAGWTVLYGRSEEGLGVPLQPFVESLDHLVAHAPLELLPRHAAEHGGELARLVPRLGRRLPHLAPDASRSEDDRYLLFRAVGALLAAVAEATPLLLVLDDLHAADRSTVLLLAHLVSTRSLPRTLVVATYRSTDLSEAHGVAELLADLHREPQIERIELGGLTVADVVSLLEGAAGEKLDEAGLEVVRRLSDETGGNAFFLAELVRSLVDSGDIVWSEHGWTARPAAVGAVLPGSVRDVVLRRVRRLGDRVHAVLSAAAVIGREFDLDLLAAVTGLGADELLDLVDVAAGSALVGELDAEEARFSFAHALVAHTLYDELSRARRRRTHRRVAEALEALNGEDLGARVGQLAHHWREAGRGAEAKALDYAVRAGDHASARRAADEAAEWYARALALLEDGPAARGRRADLLFRLGDAQRRAGNPDNAEAWREAGRLARAAGDVDTLVRVALTNTRAFAAVIGGVDPDRVAVIEAALEAVGSEDSAVRAELLAMLANELVFEADPGRRRALSDEAVAVVRRVGDARSLLRVMTLRYTAIQHPDTLEERTANLEEAVAAIDNEDDFLAFAAVRWRTNARLERGDVAGAEADLARCARMAARVGEPLRLWIAMFPRLQLTILRGRLDEAETQASELLEAGVRAAQPDAANFYGSALVRIRCEQGRLAELEPLLEQTVAAYPGMPGWRSMLALARLEAGSPAAARAMLREAAADGFASLPRDWTWFPAVAYWTEVATRTGETAACLRLLELLEPFSDRIVDQGTAPVRTVVHYLGALALAVGRFADAECHIDAAEAAHERLGARIWLAETRVLRARLLLSRDGAPSAARARPALARAVAEAEALGAGGVEREARTLLAQLDAGAAVVGRPG
jgi:tetratricopeptide (TPR) repeat protein